MGQQHHNVKMQINEENQQVQHANDVSDINLEDLTLGGASDDEQEECDEVHKMKKIIEKKTRPNL